MFDLIKYMRGATLQWELKLSAVIITKARKVHPGEREKRRREEEHLLAVQPLGMQDYFSGSANEDCKL